MLSDIYNLQYESSIQMEIPMEIQSQNNLYTIDKLISETANSVVVSAHTQTAKVAIKFIPIDTFNPNEPEIMLEKKHKHIINLIDSFQYQSKFFSMVMPVAQTDLYEYIKEKGYLPEREAKKIIADALDAIKFLHFDGIWHRDIKPDNMFVMGVTQKGPSVVIGDFGIACSTEYGEIEGKGVGTDQYAAPELIEIDYSMRYDSKFREETRCLLDFLVGRFLICELCVK